MIQKKNLWFLTLFSLVLVLSVYYITMPNDILLSSELVEKENLQNEDTSVSEITDVSIVETMKLEDEVNTLDEINDLKETIAKEDITTEDKNKAFDAIKLLNQIIGKILKFLSYFTIRSTSFSRFCSLLDCP